MGSTPIPGSTERIQVSPKQSKIKERIFKTLWSMKNDGYCETTTYATSRRLRMIVRDTDIDNPDKVREYIAQKTAINGYKENLVDIYDRYVHYNGLSWNDHTTFEKAKRPTCPRKKRLTF